MKGTFNVEKVSATPESLIDRQRERLTRLYLKIRELNGESELFADYMDRAERMVELGSEIELVARGEVKDYFMKVYGLFADISNMIAGHTEYPRDPLRVEDIHPDLLINMKEIVSKLGTVLEQVQDIFEISKWSLLVPEAVVIESIDHARRRELYPFAHWLKLIKEISQDLKRILSIMNLTLRILERGPQERGN